MSRKKKRLKGSRKKSEGKNGSGSVCAVERHPASARDIGLPVINGRSPNV